MDYTSSIIDIANNGIAKFSLKTEHAALRAITLKTATDNHDTVVTEAKKYMFRGKIEETEGHIFILTDIPRALSTVFIVPAPDCVMPSIKIEEKTVEIKTGGYSVAVGYAKDGEAEKLCRDWYRMQYRADTLHAMSNTWGDRNGRTRVCDEFIRREIDSGADLGIDVVEIDDGWQSGIPDTYDDDGLRVFADGFWELKHDIFPHGMAPLSDYAKEKGISLGLWFAPHSRGIFEKLDRDVKVLKKAHDEWKINYYKLDMLQLITEEHCEGMLDFLDFIFSFGEGISVELDVTADKRLGYLMSAPYGTIFVENRYTAWSTYYPHRTLRNMWLLSRFIPTSKFQFELVNPSLYTDKYSDNDALRPELYDIDYLFASVMLSNPLFWMETQFLPEECREKLKKIIPLWRERREALTSADVYPIGEEPSGVSMTGFAADLGDTVELVLFREITDRDTYLYNVGFDVSECELIASNTDIEFSVKAGKPEVKFGKPRSYAWLKAKKQ